MKIEYETEFYFTKAEWEAAEHDARVSNGRLLVNPHVRLVQTKPVSMSAMAEQAYDSYGAVTDYKNYQGLPMPAWKDLPPTIRLAWAHAAQRVWQICDERVRSQIIEEQTAAGVLLNSGIRRDPEVE